MYKSRQSKLRKSSRSLVSKVGNFHMSIPATMKVRLKSVDTTIHAIGFGFFTSDAANSYGPPTVSRASYSLFYPKGSYFIPTNPQTAAAAIEGKFNYPTNVIPPDPVNYQDTMKVTLYPDQMQAFGFLYKYARVERVDFIIKFSNLGASAKTTPSTAATDPHNSSAAINHTLTVLPRGQIETWGAVRATAPAYPEQCNWDLDSGHSDHIASQIAEMPGSSRLITSQDGNREIVTFRKSIDLTQKMAGDSVRQRTWMTSKNSLTNTSDVYWNYPADDASDPELVAIGTSSLIDERREAIGRTGTAPANDVWYRWSQQVSVQYHITFWENKTPAVSLN